MSARAVLLVNLGSPDSPNVPDVRRYLSEFLGDVRVIDRPENPFLRSLLVNQIIIRKRVENSAHAYASIWAKDRPGAEGSPLIATSLSVREKLESAIRESGVPVYTAMRYGKPSIATVLSEMARDGIKHVLLFPQYPHYATSSWETVVVEVREQAAQLAPRMRIDCVQPFYRDNDYIDALATSAHAHLAQPHDHVLISFHGLPERHLRQADGSHAHCLCVENCCETDSPAHATCYRAQCFKTASLFAVRTGLPAGKWSISFQSRLAGEPWLRPFTDEMLTHMPARGIKRLLVLSPAFLTDCLETLEELSITGKKTFLDAGGEFFQQIPCLNDQPVLIDFLARRTRRWLSATS